MLSIITCVSRIQKRRVLHVHTRHACLTPLYILTRIHVYVLAFGTARKVHTALVLGGVGGRVCVTALVLGGIERNSPVSHWTLNSKAAQMFITKSHTPERSFCQYWFYYEYGTSGPQICMTLACPVQLCIMFIRKRERAYERERACVSLREGRGRERAHTRVRVIAHERDREQEIERKRCAFFFSPLGSPARNPRDRNDSPISVQQYRSVSRVQRD